MKFETRTRINNKNQDKIFVVDMVTKYHNGSYGVCIILLSIVRMRLSMRCWDIVATKNLVKFPEYC